MRLRVSLSVMETHWGHLGKRMTEQKCALMKIHLSAALTEGHKRHPEPMWSSQSIKRKIYSLSTWGTYTSANFPSMLFVSFLLIYRSFFNIKDRSYYIYCKFFGHLIICLVTLWSCKYIGALIAYIFSFTVSMVGALLREALSKPKIIFLQSIIFWYIYYLFFILRSHIHLECVQ